MKKLLLTTLTILAGLSLFAQAPQSFSYQAVLRNADGSVITNQQSTVVVEILSGTTDGSPVFTETHSVTTTAQGIITITIGSIEDLSVVDWASDSYYLKITVNDVVLGVTQLLSVPYALHANTANSTDETDPVFSAWDKSTGIAITEAQVTDLKEYVTDETDPVFGAWNRSTGITITESQISDLQDYLLAESDPKVTANFDFTGATTGDLLHYNGTKWVKVTPNYLTSYTETDPTVATNFTLTGAATGDLLRFDGTKWVKFTPNYLSNFTETDPTFTAWNKSTGIQITESQISDLKNYLITITGQSIGDLQDVDLTGIAAEKILKYNATSQKWVVADAGGATETDPVFTAWDKSTGISITESQISDLGAYLETESDPAVAANFDFTNAATGDLLQFNGSKWVKVTPNYLTSFTEVDPEFTSWNKSTGITITESQVTDLKNYLTDESDPTFAETFSITAPQDGDLLKYNATSGKWEKLTPNYASTAHIHSNATTESDGFMSASDKTKINGIAEGANVNVNADWNASEGDAKILNKPTTLSGYGITDALPLSGGTVTGAISATGEATTLSGFNAALIEVGTTTYTLSSGDNGKIITVSNESDITITVPTNLPVGFNCMIVQKGTGQAIFSASGTTINNRNGFSKTAGQFAIATIVHLGENVFITSGDMNN